MARRWFGVVAVVAVLAAVVVAVALSERGAGKAPEPGSVTPSQQVGDDADLMRRLERTKR